MCDVEQMIAAGDQFNPEPRRTVLPILHALSERRDDAAALVSAAGANDAELVAARYATLRLAEAALRLLRGAESARPVQIAVLGPTQTGKSTVVNLLLGRSAAQVSPLAGFTVHAAGFIVGAAPADGGVGDVLANLPRVAYDELRSDQLDAVALTRVDAAFAAPAIVWDTPDFDSIHAIAYQRSVLEVVGLADVHVLVVSKEKYADRSVWRVLAPLAQLGRPLIICLNKLTADAAPAITAALRQRLVELRLAPPIITIDYVTHDSGPTALQDAGARLRLAVETAMAEHNSQAATARSAGVARLIRSHWPKWTRALREQHAALAEWRIAVCHAGAELAETYRRDYLDDPARFDALRLATVELLTLLEIPGVAPALRSVRQVVTWPMRQLWSAGRTLLRGAPQAEASRRSAEHGVLLDALDALLTRLERDAARRSDAHPAGAEVWRQIARGLATQRTALLTRLVSAVDALEALNSQGVRRAAAELYEALRERPALLNSLRAARATADAAGIAIAIKTGGAPLHDLIFAPALLAVTSLLTEGALGSYSRGIESSLKRQQADALQESVIRAVLTPALEEIDTLPTAGAPAQESGAGPQASASSPIHSAPMRISPAQLATADAAIEAWCAAVGADAPAEARATGGAND